MEENWKSANGSSEESLLLSQETYNTLWNMMDLSGREEMLAEVGQPVLPQVPSADVRHEAVQPTQGAHVPYAYSSLPATSNWPGLYDFKLLFEQQQQVNKHVTWTYSPADNKLYVRKDNAIPFSFRTDVAMPRSVFVRAAALYSSPEHAARVVTRCINHSQEESLNGLFEAMHLIRSESPLSRYEVNPDTGRHSVFVPWENPPAGQDYSTYIFSFRCYSSCPGGPNRRPLTLVFTLEQGGNVLGRITLDLKICACPGRDRLNAEKSDQPAAKSARTPEPSDISLPPIFPKSSEKKRKLEEKSVEKKEFSIKVKDKECYLFLTQMKKFYQTHKKICGLGPKYKDLLHFLRSSSDEDEKS